MTAQQASQPAVLTSPERRLDRILGIIPRLLASHVHVVALLGLGVWLVVLPLLGADVPARYELIGGNYTNVTSDIGACIAAGGTLRMVRQGRAHRSELAALRKELARLHEAVRQSR